MNKSFFLLFFFANIFLQASAPKDSLSLLFMGDIMGHGSQIQAAFDAASGTYNYDDVFENIAPIIKQADFAIANLEVTLAGKPYKGYPRFSSPDALAAACKNSGIDALVTANNHSCDRGERGILRTIQVLDSLGIRRTGTFKDAMDRKKNNLLILEKNNIRVGLLNYTYGTNGFPIPKPTIVNLMDSASMLSDIKKCKQLDKLIVMLHWGREYHSHPSLNQKEISRLLFENGVDIIVGSHPHVLQGMGYFQKTRDEKERFVAYSLGNFVSNQRKRKSDGGAMLELSLTKENDKVNISNCGYYLTWVNKFSQNEQQKFKILSCFAAELNNFAALDSVAKEKMKIFIQDSRSLLQEENVNVPELKVMSEKLKPKLPHPEVWRNYL